VTGGILFVPGLAAIRAMSEMPWNNTYSSRQSGIYQHNARDLFYDLRLQISPSQAIDFIRNGGTRVIHSSILGEA